MDPTRVLVQTDGLPEMEEPAQFQYLLEPDFLDGVVHDDDKVRISPEL